MNDGNGSLEQDNSSQGWDSAKTLGSQDHSPSDYDPDSKFNVLTWYLLLDKTIYQSILERGRQQARQEIQEKGWQEIREEVRQESEQESIETLQQRVLDIVMTRFPCHEKLAKASIAALGDDRGRLRLLIMILSSTSKEGAVYHALIACNPDPYGPPGNPYPYGPVD